MTFKADAKRVPDAKAQPVDTCPLCGAQVTYRGFTSVACKGRECDNFDPHCPPERTLYGDYQWALAQHAAGLEVESQWWRDGKEVWKREVPTKNSWCPPNYWRLADMFGPYLWAVAQQCAGRAVEYRSDTLGMSDAWFRVEPTDFATSTYQPAEWRLAQD